MAQWGNTDDAANSVTWATALVNLPANTTNQNNLFGNTTVGAFVPGKAVGQFGVDTTEMGVGNGSIIAIQITSPGSGYNANANIQITVGGAAASPAIANATAVSNSIGRIASAVINDAGSGLVAAPDLTIDPPAAQTFNSNTSLFTSNTFNANADVDATNEFITIASNPFVNGDVVTYTVAAGNTAVGGLTSGNSYYVVAANSTGLKLSLTSGGSAIDLTKGPTETGHTLRRDTGGFIRLGTHFFQVGDKLNYRVAAGNTAISPLANNGNYFVVSANSAGVKLSSTSGGPVINVVPGVSESGHTLRGETATAEAVISGGLGKGFHAGWVVRTVGTGGRAGRVQYETLVAMGSITGDAEDTILPDA